MDQLLQILPNLSIGVVCVGALTYITLRFMDILKALQTQYLQAFNEASERHEKVMKEREDALRNIEEKARLSLESNVRVQTEQIMKNTNAMMDVAKVMTRVVNRLDSEKQ